MGARFQLIVATSFLVACGARGGFDFIEEGAGGTGDAPASSSSSGDGGGATNSSSSSTATGGTGGTGGIGAGGAGASGGAGAAGGGGSGGGPLCQGLSSNATLITETTTGNASVVEHRVAVSMGTGWRHTVAWLDDSDNLYARMYDFVDPLNLPSLVASSVTFAAAPAVEQLQNGGAVVAYTVSNDVFLRRINAAGTAAGPVVPVSDPNGFVNRSPAVASAPDNSYAVAYRMQFPAGVRVTKYDVNGQLLGTVTATNANEQAYGAPDVAMDESGGVAVAWRAAGASPSFVHVQRFTTEGALNGPRITVNPSNNLASDPPSLGMTLDGRFVVTWVDATGTVRARTYGADGQPTTNALQVNSSGFASVQSAPFTFENEPGTRLGVADDGSFLVSWVNASTNVRTWRRFNADAAPLSTQQIEAPGMSLTWPADISVEPCGGRSTMAWFDQTNGDVWRAVFGP